MICTGKKKDKKKIYIRYYSGVLESTPAGFCVFLADSESKFCEKPDPVSSEISDLRNF